MTQTQYVASGEESLVAKFSRVFEYWENEGSATLLHFSGISNDDLPDIEEPPDYSIEECIEEMLASEIGLWQHPGWLFYLQDVIYQWVLDGKLVMLRLMSDWMLEQAPEGIWEDSTLSIIPLINQGIPEASPAQWACAWPRERDEYSRDLDLRMAALAEDMRMRFVAHTSLIAAGVTKEPFTELPRPELT